MVWSPGFSRQVRAISAVSDFFSRAGNNRRCAGLSRDSKPLPNCPRKRPHMDERATGLVLRVYPLTESSLIIHWLTQGQGRIATVAKGARRPKSPLRGKLDLFYLAEFLFARSRRS